MPAAIQIERQKEGLFRVRVREADTSTTHVVSVRPDYHQKLTRGGVTTEELIRRSFEFLLEHEPKEAILAEFDLAVIPRYFPDFEQEIRRRLAG